MIEPARFSYIERDARFSDFSQMPYLPLLLRANGHEASVSALLDTGATVNVLPYHIGEALGFVWEQERTSIRLGGNLAHLEARAVAVRAVVGTFPPVMLAFAWTRDEHAPMLLGQVNFFQEFNVCFFRSKKAFEVAPKT